MKKPPIGGFDHCASNFGEGCAQREVTMSTLADSEQVDDLSAHSYDDVREFIQENTEDVRAILEHVRQQGKHEGLEEYLDAYLAMCADNEELLAHIASNQAQRIEG